LKRELPAAINAIRHAGVAPVDMQQSVIGPGMGVFSRYAKVLQEDDSGMPVKTALSLINRVWEEIENELDANFDPETQVALAWFATYGFEIPGAVLGRLPQRQDGLESLNQRRVFFDLAGLYVGNECREQLPSTLMRKPHVVEHHLE
jgi:putative DNA methylase